MNILVISLVVFVFNLFAFGENTSAQVAVDGGDVVIINVRKGEHAADDILVYHKSSKSFFIYGYVGSEGEKGLQLMQIRNLVNDFNFVNSKNWHLELEFRKVGYTPQSIWTKVK